MEFERNAQGQRLALKDQHPHLGLTVALSSPLRPAPHYIMYTLIMLTAQANRYHVKLSYGLYLTPFIQEFYISGLETSSVTNSRSRTSDSTKGTMNVIAN